MKKLLGLFCILYSTSVLGQITVDFEDNSLDNWNQTPPERWNTIPDYSMQGDYLLAHSFDNSQSDRDRLSLPISLDFIDSTIVWRFLLRYEYNPSGSNNWGVFLLADTSAEEMYPSGEVEGFLLGVNYSGSDDFLKMWKVQSGSGFELMNTGLNWETEIGKEQTCGFQVELDSSGHWKVFLDSTGGFEQLHLLGTVQEPIFFNPGFFGIYYEYTSSADRNLFFDDLYIGNPLKDTIKPTVDTIEVISSKKLRLQFSETIQPEFLTNINAYKVTENQENPVAIEVLDSFPSEIILTFGHGMEDSLSYHLSVSVLCDEANNFLEDTLLSFRFFRTEVVGISPESGNELSVAFSRPLDSLSAVSKDNYIVNQGVGNPKQILLHNENRKEVLLSFRNDWIPGQQYSISVLGVKDMNGDSVADFTGTFYYTEEKQNDLVITEIMADPYPVAGLPEREYLEVFNRSDSTINLSGWNLLVGETNSLFHSVNIEPGDHLILCDEEDSFLFENYGDVCEFDYFPSLRNSGDYLALINPEGVVINEIYYTDQWYHDTEKDNGGYALEKIDPDNNCGGIQNWKASCNAAGGTPGEVNSVDTVNIDLNPPEIQYFEIINAHQLRVKFSEPLKPEEAESVYNYSVNGGIGSPYSVLLNTPADNAAVLSFSKALEQHIAYDLRITNMIDLCDNIAQELTERFVYHEQKINDVIINEILADPNPSVNLPPVEYIELYNRTQYPAYLHNWSLIVGGSERNLGEFMLPGNEYAILCDKENVQLFPDEAKVFGVDQFPSINNSGEPLLLKHRNFNPVNYVLFDNSWYQSDYKREGGWSLELIDPDNPCEGQNNWGESVASEGGTPGEENSVFDSNPDLDQIRLIKAYVVDSITLGLRFDEPFLPSSVNDPEKFYVENFGHPIGLEIKEPEFTSVELQFNRPFQREVRYVLNVKDSVKDCAGNVIDEWNQVEFEIPSEIRKNDLVINEILFNPEKGGYDFVEVYNRSQKTVDLKEINLATCEEYTGMYDQICSIPYEGYLLFPGDYAVFTVAPGWLKKNYKVKHPYNLLNMYDLPTYPDGEGTVAIVTASLQVIDQMSYREEMHFPLLEDTEGVSLERINYDVSSKDEGNWHSAAAIAGYATPGYLNSQFSEKEKKKEGKITVEPEVFSPDNDGFRDIVQIHYQFDKPGVVAHVKIFDSQGRRVRYLVNNQTLSTSGHFTWNGLNDRGDLLKNGIYLVYVRTFNLSGKVEEFKLPCVLGKNN